MDKIKRKHCQARIPVDLLNRAKGVARLTGDTMTDLIIEGLELALAAKRQDIASAIDNEIAVLQQLKGN
jgi:hypothetical protein